MKVCRFGDVLDGRASYATCLGISVYRYAAAEGSGRGASVHFSMYHFLLQRL